MFCKVTHCAGHVSAMHDKHAHVKLCHDDLQAEETIVIKTFMLKITACALSCMSRRLISVYLTVQQRTVAFLVTIHTVLYVALHEHHVTPKFKSAGIRDKWNSVSMKKKLKTIGETIIC